MSSLRRLSLSTLKPNRNVIADWVRILYLNRQLTHLTLWFAFDDAEDYDLYMREVDTARDSQAFGDLVKVIGKMKDLRHFQLVSAQLRNDEIDTVTSCKKPGFEMVFVYGHIRFENLDTCYFNPYSLEEQIALQ